MATKIIHLSIEPQFLTKLEQEKSMSGLIAQLIREHYNKPINMSSEERKRLIKELEIKLEAQRKIEAL